MKAIELHLGSSLYRATADEIVECSIDALNINDGKIYVQSGSGYYGRVQIIMNPDDTEGCERDTQIVYYLNLDDAEMAQLLKREKAVKYAFRLMEEHQKDYQIWLQNICLRNRLNL